MESENSFSTENKPKTNDQPDSEDSFPNSHLEHAFKADFEESLSLLKNLLKSPETPRQSSFQLFIKSKPNQLYNHPNLRPNDIYQYCLKRSEQIIKNRKVKKIWGPGDFDVLNWVTNYIAWRNEIIDIENGFTETEWESVSKLILGTDSKVCMFKWLYCLNKKKVSEDPLDSLELQTLKQIVKQQIELASLNNVKWQAVCQELYFRTKRYRSSKQCKQHWMSLLNPSLRKGPWNLYEDNVLLNAVKEKNGEKRWVHLVKHFEGRTQNAIKNRYNLLLEKEKKLQNDPSKTELELIESIISRNKRDAIIEPDSEEEEMVLLKATQKSPRYKVSKRTYIKKNQKFPKKQITASAQINENLSNEGGNVDTVQSAGQKDAISQPNGELISPYQSELIGFEKRFEDCPPIRQNYDLSQIDLRQNSNDAFNLFDLEDSF